ncbi:hypothetical protein M9Y10_033311 [Tritrichomonas musculus]|uniref:Uncharacterized protein n=1 Tax=Tritrichomonas musculus TaxID=1915356 RepID=A0ABR2KBT1_9EUKA
MSTTNTTYPKSTNNNLPHVSFTLPEGYDGKPSGLSHSEMEEYSLGFGRFGPSAEYSSSDDNDDPDVRPPNHPIKNKVH